jgi:tetratricopeptide (TPR) repeat protein
MPTTRQLAKLAALLAALCAPGCKSLCKRPVAENVVEARQISMRAMEAMQQGHDEEAEKLFAQALEVCPVDERARCRYADLLWRRGQHAQAVKQMEEAARLSGGDAGLLVQLGQMQLARGEKDKAGDCAKKAVQSDRNLASAWALLGDTQRAAYDSEAALASYHKALSLQEFYPPVQMAVAEIYRSQNKPQRSLATLAALEDRYTTEPPPIDLLLSRALALKQLGRYEDAAQSLTIAIARGATSADVFCELADAQLQAGDTTNARLSASAALEVSPDHVRGRQLMAALQSEAARTARLR